MPGDDRQECLPHQAGPKDYGTAGDDMIDFRIYNELERVRLRYRRLTLRVGLAICWAAVAVAGLMLLAGVAFAGIGAARLKRARGL